MHERVANVSTHVIMPNPAKGVQPVSNRLVVLKTMVDKQDAYAACSYKRFDEPLGWVDFY